MDKNIKDILDELRLIENKDRQLNEWSIPEPVKKAMGFMFNKLMTPLALIGGAKEVVTLYNQGKTAEAIISGLHTIGWILPGGLATMAIYEICLYLYEHKDEIIQYIDEFIEEHTKETKPSKLSPEKLQALKLAIQKLEQIPNKESNPKIQQVIDAYYKKYGNN